MFDVAGMTAVLEDGLDGAEKGVRGRVAHSGGEDLRVNPEGEVGAASELLQLIDDGIGEGNVDLGRRFLEGGHHGRERQGMLHVKELALGDCEA